MTAIKPTCDRKTRMYKTQKNTFGLLPGPEETCPHATTEDGGCWYIAPGKKLPECYVTRTMSVYKGVRGLLAHNTRLLKKASKDEMVTLLMQEFERFRDSEMRRKSKGRKYSLMYRLHWSGDIFNKTYAHALKTAIADNHDIFFWIYTRSFFAVPILKDIPNLNVYYSLDPVNISEGLKHFASQLQNRNKLSIAYMNPVNDFKHHFDNAYRKLRNPDKLKRLTTVKKLIPCPVDIGKMKLEHGCDNCKQCTKTRPRAIWFKS